MNVSNRSHIWKRPRSRAHNVQLAGKASAAYQSRIEAHFSLRTHILWKQRLKCADLRSVNLQARTGIAPVWRLLFLNVVPKTLLERQFAGQIHPLSLHKKIALANSRQLRGQLNVQFEFLELWKGLVGLPKLNLLHFGANFAVRL